MQLKVLSKFIGPNIYSFRAGLVFSFEPPDTIPFEINSLGDEFHSEISDTLKRIQLHPEKHGDVLRARNLGELLIVLALQIQRHLGAYVERGRLLKREPSGRCHLFYECETIDVGIQAGHVAGRLIADILLRSGISSPKEAINSEVHLNNLIRFSSQQGLRGAHRYLMNAAHKAGFPAIFLGEKMLQLGHGRFRRFLWQSITDATPWTAVERSTDKVTTMQLLKDLGLNVPAQHVVKTPEQAIEAARIIGFPAVAKPRSQDRQIGVTLDIENEKELVTAFETARKFGPSVIIEEMLQGQCYRALVVDGVIVSAVERQRMYVVGDGEHMVAEVVDQLNLDPRRGHGGNTPFVLLDLDEKMEGVLAAQGYTRSSVLENGERVFLNNYPLAVISEETRDVTDLIHPELLEAMLLGVRALGLDIAGVDYITPDITLPPSEAGGGFCEINCTPLLQPYYATAPRDIASPIFNMLFSDGRPEHVPIIAICSETHKPQIYKKLTTMLEKAGYTVGSATRNGLCADGKLLDQNDSTSPMSARTLLQDVRINAAIIETPVDVVIEQGLGIDSCDIVIIDALEESGAKERLDARTQALKALANLAQRVTVIDFDHPLREKLVQGRNSGDFIFVSTRPNSTDFDQHASNNGVAIVFDGEANPQSFTVINGDGPNRQVLCPELEKTDDFEANIYATAFAIAVALAMDISTDLAWQRAYDT